MHQNKKVAMGFGAFSHYADFSSSFACRTHTFKSISQALCTDRARSSITDALPTLNVTLVNALVLATNLESACKSSPSDCMIFGTSLTSECESIVED